MWAESFVNARSLQGLCWYLKEVLMPPASSHFLSTEHLCLWASACFISHLWMGPVAVLCVFSALVWVPKGLCGSPWVSGSFCVIWLNYITKALYFLFLTRSSSSAIIFTLSPRSRVLEFSLETAPHPRSLINIFFPCCTFFFKNSFSLKRQHIFVVECDQMQRERTMLDGL